jgi:hypothetical protein
MLRHQRSRANCASEPDHETDPDGPRNHPLLRWREPFRQQHAEEKCAQRGARTLAIRGWRYCEEVATPASYLNPKGKSGLEHDVKKAGDARIPRARCRSGRSSMVKADCLNASLGGKMRPIGRKWYRCPISDVMTKILLAP